MAAINQIRRGESKSQSGEDAICAERERELALPKAGIVKHER